MTMLSRSAKDTVWFTVVCFLALITSVFAECTRERLLAAANIYVDAFSAGRLDGLQLASSNFTYQENNKAADIKRGILSQSHNISLNRSTADTIACASYTMIIETAANRPSRELLRKVGDAYLDMWTDAKAADSIPWGADCERVEGSQYTRPCGVQLPRGGSSKRNGNRRYVIDEVMGSVDVLYSFDALGNMPDSHEIRVEDGEVKYVHTITVI